MESIRLSAFYVFYCGFVQRLIQHISSKVTSPTPLDCTNSNEVILRNMVKPCESSWSNRYYQNKTVKCVCEIYCVNDDVWSTLKDGACPIDPWWADQCQNVGAASMLLMCLAHNKNEDSFKHIDVNTRWPLFGIRQFQFRFVKWKLLHIGSRFIKMCLKESNKQQTLTIGPSNYINTT